MKHLVNLFFSFTFAITIFAQDSKEITPLRQSGNESSVSTWRPDGKFILSGGLTGKITKWDFESKAIIKTIANGKKLLLALSYNSQGNMYASANEDGQITLFNEINDEVLGTYEAKSTVTSLQFSNDGTKLIYGTVKGTFSIIDLSTKQTIKEISLGKLPVSDIALDKQGVLIAVASFDGNVYCYKFPSLELIHTFHIDKDKVRSTAISSDSKYIAIGYENKQVLVYNLKDYSLYGAFAGCKEAVTGVDFLNDLKNIVAIGTDNVLRFWSFDSKKELKTLKGFFNSISLSVAPDDQHFTVSDLSKELKLIHIPENELNTRENKKTSTLVATKNPTKASNMTLAMVQPSETMRGASIMCFSKDYTLKANLKSDVGIYEVLVNDTEVSAENGIINHTIKLSFGKNPITLKITDLNGTVKSEQFTIVRKIQEADTLSRRGNDYALIIATDEFENFNKLSNPINDGTTIAKELEATYGFKTEIVTNPTRNSILTKLREYSKKVYADDDQLFIFIAGHGEYDKVFNEGYVVAKDSKNNDEIKESYLAHSNLRQYIANIPCKHVLLMMDVCFGGTFGSSARGSEYEETDKKKFIVKKLSYKTRLFVTSGGKEYVPDGRPGEHSPFARKIIDALRGNGGTDGIITFGELWTAVEKCQPGPTNGEFTGNQPGSDFLFIKRDK